MDTIEILKTKEQVRRIANSIYICIPSYLVRSREIIPGDPVSVTVMSDGTLRITFIKEVQK
jgi:antitoxin component of MazEF toxin-antitoxin module